MENQIKIEELKDKIINGDCRQVLKKFPSNSINLIFADPPYNIGIKYDTHNDTMSSIDYLQWCEEWINECARVLREDGSFYLAIGDEYAAEIVLMLKEKGLILRNWIIWYYTFGQSQRKKFNRSHTHILYFVKNDKNFTFNPDNIRVESVRLKIGDKRANPKGKVPDDVWQISRVAGTFNERVKDFPCQMPLQLLERVINASSNKKDIVLDPFMGSGTTAVACKKMDRIYIGVEVSEKYYEDIKIRLETIEDFE